MDAPLIPSERSERARPVRWKPSYPYVQFRFHPQGVHDQNRDPVAGRNEKLGQPEKRNGLQVTPTVLRQQVRQMVRSSKLSTLFDAYRPYENFKPDPVSSELATAIQNAGFSYMLSKSGFGEPPHVVWQDGDFVALNYTAGHWDGWTPFETINDVRDLRRAEKTLLASGGPGWLLGGIDTCLWTFSGELWDRAPGLASIARFVASGGSSGKLINVPPRVLARYARVTAQHSDTAP